MGVFLYLRFVYIYMYMHVYDITVSALFTAVDIYMYNTGH